MSLFQGLEALGLGDFSEEDIFAEHMVNKEASLNKQNKEPEIKEIDLIFDKSHDCPVCEKSFKAKTLRNGKVRMRDMDQDLKPNFDYIEPLKYDIVVCPHCGYAVANKYFSALALTQKKLVKEKICDHFKGIHVSEDVYSYDEALDRYKLALACAMVKISKASEKAYLCLKAGWLARSYIKELENAENRDEAKITELRTLEEDFLRKAYDGYLMAIGNEQMPISGMDERTIDYLLGALGCRFNDFDVSVRMVQKILLDKNTPKRIKDKTLILKEELAAKVKASKS